MTVFWWILVSALAMSVIALVGSVTLLMGERTLGRILLPLVAFAAGSLLGGAFFHMLPAALAEMGPGAPVFAWLLFGFSVFFVLEQFLHWRHAHVRIREGPVPRPAPLTYLILVGDGLHNFLGGLAVASAFLVDLRVGIATWLAAAAHEVPQELGDFGILVHGGWSRRKALLLNFLSALTFVVGALLAYAASRRVDVTFLLPFAAGNFLYIAASDLVPEVKHGHDLRRNLTHFVAFAGGILLLFLLAAIMEH